MCIAASLFLLLAHRVSLSRQISLGIVTIFSLTISLSYYLGAHGMTALEQAYMARVNADLATLADQLDLYRACTGLYPTTEQGLDALVERPTKLPIPSGWRHLLVDVPKDPWNTPYQYRCPGTRSGSAYDLFSAGPDQRSDTRDDIYHKK
jgi:general secretion pathway protein G